MLINNAGTAEPGVSVADLTADQAMQGFSINVLGAIRVIHHDAAFTMRTYVHASDEDLKEGTRTLAKLHKIA